MLYTRIENVARSLDHGRLLFRAFRHGDIKGKLASLFQFADEVRRFNGATIKGSNVAALEHRGRDQREYDSEIELSARVSGESRRKQSKLTRGNLASFPSSSRE